MMVMQKTPRSAMAKDILRYIRLKQVLGRHFENGSRVLLSLDGFLSDLGKPSADLTPERFQKWGQTLEPLSSNTKRRRRFPLSARPSSSSWTDLGACRRPTPAPRKSAPRQRSWREIS